MTYTKKTLRNRVKFLNFSPLALVLTLSGCNYSDIIIYRLTASITISQRIYIMLANYIPNHDWDIIIVDVC